MVTVQTKVLDDVHALVTQYSTIDEGELHCQSMIVAEEAHMKNSREMVEKLKALKEN